MPALNQMKLYHKQNSEKGKYCTRTEGSIGQREDDITKPLLNLAVPSFASKTIGIRELIDNSVKAPV